MQPPFFIGLTELSAVDRNSGENGTTEHEPKTRPENGPQRFV